MKNKILVNIEIITQLNAWFTAYLSIDFLIRGPREVFKSYLSQVMVIGCINEKHMVIIKVIIIIKLITSVSLFHYSAS